VGAGGAIGRGCFNMVGAVIQYYEIDPVGFSVAT
jgi:hypothetical protein